MAASVIQVVGINRASNNDPWARINNVQAGSLLVMWSYKFNSDTVGTPYDNTNNIYTAVPGAHVVNSNASGMNAWTAPGVPSGNYTIKVPGDWYQVVEVGGADNSPNLVDTATNVALGIGGSGVSGSDETGNISTSQATLLHGCGLAWCIFESSGGTSITNNTTDWTMDANFDAFSSSAHKNDLNNAVQQMKWIERNQTGDQFTAIILAVKVKPPEPAKLTRGFR